jgi:hypothetical protein
MAEHAAMNAKAAATFKSLHIAAILPFLAESTRRI